MVKKTREEWQNILDSEIWQVEDFEKDILPAVLLSYNDLSNEIKQCRSVIYLHQFHCLSQQMSDRN